MIYAGNNNNKLELRMSPLSVVTDMNIDESWHSIILRKTTLPDNNNVVDLFLDGNFLYQYSAPEFIQNPNQEILFFSQYGKSNSGGYSTPSNDLAYGAVAFWSRSLSDGEISNLYLAATQGIDVGSSGGILIPDNGNATRIQGVVTEDDKPVSRRLYAFTEASLEVSGSSDRQHAVLSSASSDPNNGTYTLDTSPYEGSVIVVAVDDYGTAWQPQTDYSTGERDPTGKFSGLCLSL